MRDLVCWSRPAICCLSVAIKSSCISLPPLLCCGRSCERCTQCEIGITQQKMENIKLFVLRSMSKRTASRPDCFAAEVWNGRMGWRKEIKLNRARKSAKVSNSGGSERSFSCIKRLGSLQRILKIMQQPAWLSHKPEYHQCTLEHLGISLIPALPVGGKPLVCVCGCRLQGCLALGGCSKGQGFWQGFEGACHGSCSSNGDLSCLPAHDSAD